jgi:hypothetical protein
LNNLYDFKTRSVEYINANCKLLVLNKGKIKKSRPVIIREWVTCELKAGRLSASYADTSEGWLRQYDHTYSTAIQSMLRIVYDTNTSDYSKVQESLHRDSIFQFLTYYIPVVIPAIFYLVGVKHGVKATVVPKLGVVLPDVKVTTTLAERSYFTTSSSSSSSSTSSNTTPSASMDIAHMIRLNRQIVEIDLKNASTTKRTIRNKEKHGHAGQDLADFASNKYQEITHKKEIDHPTTTSRNSQTSSRMECAMAIIIALDIIRTWSFR